MENAFLVPIYTNFSIKLKLRKINQDRKDNFLNI